MAGRTAADRALIGDVRAGFAPRRPRPGGGAAGLHEVVDAVLRGDVAGNAADREGVFRSSPAASFRAWRDTVLELWRKAGFREERYVALEPLVYN